MLSYRWYLEQKKISRYLLVLLWFALSLLSKPMAVTLPFVLLLIDYWPLRRFCLHTHKVEADPSVGYLRSFIKPVLEKVPLFLLSTISSAITIKAQTEGGAVISSEAIPLWARAANALRSYGYYLYQTICPRSLSIFYPHPETAINMMEVMAAGLVVSIVTILVIRFAKRCPYLVAGWFLYLGMLVPVIGFFKQAGTQGMADRYMYLPSIGLAIMVSWGIPEFIGRYKPSAKRFQGAAMVLVLCAWGTGTWTQVSYWQDSISLFGHAVEIMPRNSYAWFQIGAELGRQGRLDEAIPALNEALRIDPLSPNVHKIIGWIYFDKGHFQEAEGHFREAAYLAPWQSGPRMGLALTAFRQGRLEAALKLFQEVLAIEPGNEEAIGHIGEIRGRLNGIKGQ